MRLRIATRQSPLALWQAEHVKAELEARLPGLEIDLVKRLTKGDKILDQALSRVGGKDLFVKEIEDALLCGEAEIAVHSLKDMPTDLPAGLVVTAFPRREDPRDAFVSASGGRLADVPRGARIGTSSLRRAAQILRHRPDVEIVSIRGNVGTRLGKIEELRLAGVVLAHAGLLRLGLGHRVSEVLDPAWCLPAIGQGILAVETRADDASAVGMVKMLDDAASRAAALAERAFLRRLQGGCQVPIAGHATLSGGELELTGLVASLDGKTVVEGRRRGPVADAEALGRALGDELLGRGAGAILAALGRPVPA